MYTPKYREWILEFGDLKSDNLLLRGCIWPITTRSNQLYTEYIGVCPRLRHIWGPNTMESRTIVFAVFDLMRTHVCLWKYEVTIRHGCKPSTSSSHQGRERPVLGKQHFEHLAKISVTNRMATDDHDERLKGALAVVALVVSLTYEKRRRDRTLA